MDQYELGSILNGMYENAKTGETVLMIHLFGIKYASEIRKCKVSMKEIAKAANIPESYATEINKGVNLAKYVMVKNK